VVDESLSGDWPGFDHGKLFEIEKGEEGGGVWLDDREKHGLSRRSHKRARVDVWFFAG